MYKVSRLDWQDIYQEYRISGLTKSAFLKDRFAALWPNAKQPSRTTFFNRIRQLEKQLSDRNESLVCIDEPSELSEGAAPSVRVHNPRNRARGFRLSEHDFHQSCTA